MEIDGLTEKEREKAMEIVYKWNAAIKEANPEGKYTIDEEFLKLGRRNAEEKRKAEVRVGNWVAGFVGAYFNIHQAKHALSLVANKEEGLEKMIFDTEKKTISVVVRNPKRPTWPRTVDLSNVVEFFDAVRDKIESILTAKYGGYSSVTANEDRTVFDVK